MKIEFNWKVGLVFGLIITLIVSVLKYESVANTFASHFGAILAAIGAF